MTWKIEPHDNYMCDENQLPIQIVDGDGKVVACNTDFYPTAITAEHAAKIVLAVNEVAELREQLATVKRALAGVTDAFLDRHGCFPLDNKAWKAAMTEAYRIVGQPHTADRTALGATP